jgi:hypothetical protein
MRLFDIGQWCLVISFGLSRFRQALRGLYGLHSAYLGAACMIASRGPFRPGRDLRLLRSARIARRIDSRPLKKAATTSMTTSRVRSEN